MLAADMNRRNWMSTLGNDQEDSGWKSHFAPGAFQEEERSLRRPDQVQSDSFGYQTRDSTRPADGTLEVLVFGSGFMTSRF